VNGILDAAGSLNGEVITNNHPLYIGKAPWTSDQCGLRMYELRIYNLGLLMISKSIHLRYQWKILKQKLLWPLVGLNHHSLSLVVIVANLRQQGRLAQKDIISAHRLRCTALHIM
jgi:hypothetical protein